MTKHFSIAIDGPSGAGKSSVARAVAGALGAVYLDTGAMYRAVGLYMLRSGIATDDIDSVSSAVQDVRVGIRYQNGEQRVYLMGEDVSEAIRTGDISLAASAVSAIPAVRGRLVAQQREIAKSIDVVMDGRDIGTKVLPDAGLKVFLTADAKLRAKWRHAELLAKGAQDSYDQVYADLIKRDHNDSTRAASPLAMAEDAVLIDSSGMTLPEVVEKVLALARERIGG